MPKMQESVPRAYRNPGVCVFHVLLTAAELSAVVHIHRYLEL